MTFIQSISTCFKKYATFSGRASLSEYWWWYLFYIIVYVCASGVDTIIGLQIAGTSTGIISTICSLVLCLPTLSVAIRRYHDSNHSGWWILCPIYNIILLFFKSVEGDNKY